MILWSEATRLMLYQSMIQARKQFIFRNPVLWRLSEERLPNSTLAFP